MLAQSSATAKQLRWQLGKAMHSAREQTRKLERQVAVLCGRGSNGGDALYAGAAARRKGVSESWG